MEENEKIINLIEEFTQQTQAEVKLKQKIKKKMSIICLVNY